jgi:N-acetyl-gamma-glutamyl-phosphate reductase
MSDIGSVPTGGDGAGFDSSMHSTHIYPSMDTADRTGAAVLGASGYVGGELVRLLARHPALRLTTLGASSAAGRTLADVHPHLASLPDAGHALTPIEELDPSTLATHAEFVFCALPHGATADLAPGFLEAGLRVIDLGGDFRLRPEDYPVWYGFEHPAPGWVDKSVYGLTELFGSEVHDAQLIANPGCFPTPAVLGLAPLLAEGLVLPGLIRVDGKTGLSGAGRRSDEATQFTSAEESIRPYRFPGHQHTPEIERGLARATGEDVRVLFVPHVVPAARGVVVTCYAPLAVGVSTDRLVDALSAAYVQHPFVRVLVPGAMVDSKRVRGTNVVELQAAADERTGTAVVVGAIDNLGKGAAGQAVQNLNVALGIDETVGLATEGLYP